MFLFLNPTKMSESGDPMPVQTIATVAEMIHVSPFAWSMTLEAGDMVRSSFRGPGQFVHVKCGHSRLLRRPISVCACSSGEPGDLLRLVFEVRGEGTAWLARRRPNDKVDLLGLLGNGFSMDPKGRYLLVGGGIGVPPLLGCAQYAPHGCDAVLGFRDGAHALLTDEFQARCSHVALATEDGSLGEKGFVTGPMAALLEQNRYDAVLCCGPGPMLKAAAGLAARYGVPCQVSLEERMACGVGACLGCAVPMADGAMKHVCKDGPVFDAGEVGWNG